MAKKTTPIASMKNTPAKNTSKPAANTGTVARRTNTQKDETLVLHRMGNARKPLLKQAVGTGNYVQFVSSKSKNRDSICEALGSRSSQMDEDFPALCKRGEWINLDPFRFILTAQWFQYFAKFSDTLELVESVIDVDETPGRDWTECNEGLIIVVTPDDELIPAVCNFKGTKAGAFHAIHTAIDERKSETNINGVYNELMLEVVIEDYNAKRTRRELRVCDWRNQIVHDVPKGIQKELENAFSDPDFLGMVEECIDMLKTRFEEVEKKAS